MLTYSGYYEIGIAEVWDMVDRYFKFVTDKSPVHKGTYTRVYVGHTQESELSNLDVWVFGRCNQSVFRVGVDNLFSGMIYTDELIDHPEIGSTVRAFVKKIREDGKIDLTLKDTNGERAHQIADKIIDLLHKNGGHSGKKSTNTGLEPLISLLNSSIISYCLFTGS